MGYISESTVEEIYNTIKIEDVIGEFINLKKRGINLLGLCPFHNEKTPSFTVSPAKGIYKCFGCGVGGNAVNFVMEHEQLSYPEALRFLANRYGIEIEEEEVSEEVLERQQISDSLYIVNKFAEEHFQSQLFNTDYGQSVGLNYFKERGLREETIKRFALGFANGQNSDFVQKARTAGYELDILQKAGLASKYKKDFFRNRVMFPIHNLSGKVLGFGGRILTSDKKQPKYLNTPESEIYHKSKILYGIHQARKPIVTADLCYMVEGYMDVLALSQAGIGNVVASSGTSLTVGQIQLVKRYTPNLTILYDGDAAGIKAAMRGLELVLEQDMNVKIVLVPEGEDPDSYLQKVGLTAFKNYLEKESADFVLFKTRRLLKDAANDPIKKSELLNDLVSTIAKIPDALKRAVYVKECSRLLEVDEQILHVEINKKIAYALKKHRSQEEREATATRQQDLPPPLEDGSEQAHQAQGPQQGNKHEYLERDIARILILFGHRPIDEKETVAEFVLLNMAELLDEFDSDRYAQIVEIYIEHLEKRKKINTDFFTQHRNPEIANMAINLIATPYEYSPGWERLDVYLTSQKFPEENHVADAKSSILRFKLSKIGRVIEKNQKELKKLQENKDSYEAMLKVMKVHSKLMQLRGDIAAELNTVVLK